MSVRPPWKLANYINYSGLVPVSLSTNAIVFSFKKCAHACTFVSTLQQQKEQKESKFADDGVKGQATESSDGEMGATRKKPKKPDSVEVAESTF